MQTTRISRRVAASRCRLKVWMHARQAARPNTHGSTIWANPVMTDDPDDNLMLLTGRYLQANEAKDLGLINRVVPLKDLTAETDALALQIADASRFVLAIGKQGFYAQVDQTDNNAMHYAKHTIAMNLSAKDAQHGIDAFLNKKTPIWKDR